MRAFVYAAARLAAGLFLALAFLAFVALWAMPFVAAL